MRAPSAGCAPRAARRQYAGHVGRRVSSLASSMYLTGRMRGCSWWTLTAAAAVLLATSGAVLARRLDQDFEFDDDAAPPAPDPPPEAVVAGGGGGGGGGLHSRRPRRYVYDPHNTLCRSLICKKREVCLLRDAFTALCATKKDILRKGDVIVSAADEYDDGDDVFYDTRENDAGPGPGAGVDGGSRCVGCGGGARAQFLCGSDNRTYSSLCRLDLHNCVRRPAPAVRLACRGFCPCERDVRRSHAARRPGSRRRRPTPAAGAGCALDKMADRLLDWFSVLMEEAGATPPPAEGFPGGCKGEVRWMFEHLDGDDDGALSASELYALRHDDRERCLRPFLAGCGGAGGGVTRGAWCGCLRRAARPCTALARAVSARAAAGGGYVPACDARGYYRPRQCHAALGVCWCVDAHGAEVPGSRARGASRCPPSPPAGGPPAQLPPADDEDADTPGSGDGPF